MILKLPYVISYSQLLDKTKIVAGNNRTKLFGFHFLLISLFFEKGLARTQIPTNINYAIEFPTFGEIAGVNPTEVQWKGLALEEPP